MELERSCLKVQAQLHLSSTHETSIAFSMSELLFFQTSHEESFPRMLQIQLPPTLKLQAMARSRSLRGTLHTSPATTLSVHRLAQE